MNPKLTPSNQIIIQSITKPGLETAATGLVNNEANSLALLDVVKTHNSDVRVGILLTTFTYFVEYILGIRVTKHG